MFGDRGFQFSEQPAGNRHTLKDWSNCMYVSIIWKYEFGALL